MSTDTSGAPLDLTAVAASSVPFDVPPVTPPTASGEAADAPADAPSAEPRKRGRPLGSGRKAADPAGAQAGDKRPARPPREPRSSATLRKHVGELYTAAGMMMLPFDQPCGTVVVNSADQCAESLVKLAEENETVRRILESMVQTSAIGGVIVAHMPIMMAVMAHHIAPQKMPEPNVVPFHHPQSPNPPTPDDTVKRDTEPRRPATRGPARVRPNVGSPR